MRPERDKPGRVNFQVEGRYITRMNQPKNPALFYGAIAVAVVALILCVYYALPGVNHVFISGSHKATDPQPAHIVLFLALTVLGIAVALVTRPKSSVRR
jgi:hypothetical protein